MSQQNRISKGNTTIHTELGVTTVRYHSTDVVQFDQDIVHLDTGDWRTVTTKSRMNQTSNQFDLGYRVFVKDGEWFVRLRDYSVIPFDGDTVTFKRSYAQKKGAN